MKSMLPALFFLLSFSMTPVINADSFDATQKNIEAIPALSSIPVYAPRFDRAQPVIAVVAENSYTELTDYVVPYGVLTASGVARVFALATEAGTIRMFPALQVKPQASIDEFDKLFPEGADYVIVPAVHLVEDPRLLSWVQQQAQKGATLVGVCDGVWVLAHSGLLKQHSAVGHWYSFEKLQKKFPDTQWLTNQRYLADGKIITTTGVSASIPVSLALVEAIAGREQAQQLANKLGVESWDAQHNSELFSLNKKHLVTAGKNTLAFWAREKIAIPIDQGVDEIALALAADAYARSYRSSVLSLAADFGEVSSARGLVFLPDQTFGAGEKVHRSVHLDKSHPSLAALDLALVNLEQWYGVNTAAFVALQLEYAWEQPEN